MAGTTPSCLSYDVTRSVMTMATWLITGCSTGLGRALAEAVLDAGHSTVVTARKDSAVQDLVDAHPDTALGLALDVTDPVQVADAVQRAEERFGRIDVLVNNAGYGYRAAVEEGDEADVWRLFDTNLFGAIAMIKAALPLGHTARAVDPGGFRPDFAGRSLTQAAEAMADYAATAGKRRKENDTV